MTAVHPEFNGYDLIYSVSLDVVAKQFQLLYVEGVLPTSWKNTLSHTQASIDVRLGPPALSISLSSAGHPLLELSMPISSGTFSYLSDGVQKSIELSESVLMFAGQMSMGQLDCYSASAKVTQKLKNINASDFSVEQLFLDLDDVDLIESVQLILPSNQALEPSAKKQLTLFFSALISDLKSSGNPYILGYSVISKKVNQTNTTWVPTHLNFGIYYDPKFPKKASINYLIMIAGRKPPAAEPPQGSWLDQPGEQGCFAISAHVLLPKLKDQLAAALQRPASIFVNSKAVVPNNIGGDTTCMIVGVEHEIEVITLSTFDKSVKDRLGTKIGTLSGELESTIKLVFSINDANGHIAIKCSSSKPRVVKKIVHKNFIGTLESILAVIVDDLLRELKINLLKGFFEALVSQDWSKPISDEYNTKLQAMKTNFILPAGSVLFFKDVRVLNACNMIVTTTIKD